MAIELDTKIARELVEMKLQSIRSTINEILGNWDYSNAEEFITKAKSGEIEEAEMDAITLRQLLKDLEQFEQLLQKIIHSG